MLWGVVAGFGGPSDQEPPQMGCNSTSARHSSEKLGRCRLCFYFCFVDCNGLFSSLRRSLRRFCGGEPVLKGVCLDGLEGKVQGI